MEFYGESELSSESNENPMGSMEMITQMAGLYSSGLPFEKAEGFYRANSGIFWVNESGLFFSSDEGKSWKEAGNLALRQQIDALVITNEEIIVWSRNQSWKASLAELQKLLVD
jgi:hypothetical protein